MKHFQTYELALSDLAEAGDAHICPVAIQAARETFHAYRGSKLSSIETGIAEWNGAVASAVERVGQQNGLATIEMGLDWHARIATALRDMKTPLHSEVILSVENPYLWNAQLSGRLRVFGALTMSENPEFMPSTTTEWPRFPYFLVEPGTLKSLADQKLALLGNPPSVDEDEKDVVGAAIASATYARSPMVSVELDIDALPDGKDGALLINWSFRGRQGAMAKVFVDGLLDVPAFPVGSTDEDRTPNFWSVVPMRTGTTVIDLKHVGAGFMWFDHADVHSVIW